MTTIYRDGFGSPAADATFENYLIQSSESEASSVLTADNPSLPLSLRVQLANRDLLNTQHQISQMFPHLANTGASNSAFSLVDRIEIAKRDLINTQIQINQIELKIAQDKLSDFNAQMRQTRNPAAPSGRGGDRRPGRPGR